MAAYIIPIFCFGLVITGIVFLGVQQALDMAKQLAEQSNEMPPESSNPPALSERGSAAIDPLSNVRHS